MDIVLFLIILTVILLCKVDTNAATVAQGNCGKYGYSVTWLLDDEGTLTISGTGEMENYAEYGPGPWYQYKNRISHIVVGNGITSISNFAFAGLDCVVGVTMSDDVETICRNAFYNCSCLKSIYLSKKISGLPEYVFCDCRLLNEINFPDGLTFIGKGCFEGCGIITLPCLNNLVEIDEYAFAYSGLKTLYLNNSVEIIESLALDECDLNAVYYKGSLQEWVYANYDTACMASGADLYLWNGENYYLLENIDNPKGIISVGGGAFLGCTSLKHVAFDENTIKIGGSAFSSCKNLESAEIVGVTMIGNYLFSRCTNLKSVIIKGDISSIDGVFTNCEKLQEVVLPESLTTIREYTFSGCKSLTQIEIGPNVKTIGQCAFEKCSSLKYVFYSGSESDWKKIDVDSTYSANNPLLKASIHYNAKDHYGGTATCKNKAFCEVCGAPYGELNPENHTGETEIRDEIKPTCTIDGYSGDVYCIGCGEKLETGKAVTATGHSGGTASCDSPAICSICGEPYGELNPENHTGEIEIRDEIKPTCTSDGYSGDIYCKSCKEKLETGKIVKATDHNYAHYKVAAKVGIVGSEYDKCSVCGVIKNRKTIAALKPAITKISKLTAGSKSFTVKWAKKSYTGYQIRYSLKSSMASAKMVTITKASILSKKITKLKGRKKYYVQMRTYKTVSGKKWYSAWCTKKAIITKK